MFVKFLIILYPYCNKWHFEYFYEKYCALEILEKPHILCYFYVIPIAMDCWQQNRNMTVRHWILSQKIFKLPYPKVYLFVLFSLWKMHSKYEFFFQKFKKKIGLWEARPWTKFHQTWDSFWGKQNSTRDHLGGNDTRAFSLFNTQNSFIFNLVIKKGLLMDTGGIVDSNENNFQNVQQSQNKSLLH